MGLIRPCNKATRPRRPPNLTRHQKHVDKNSNRDLFQTLPPELIINIHSSLDCRSLCRARQVSKQWKACIDHTPALWQGLLASDYGIQTQQPRPEIALLPLTILYKDIYSAAHTNYRALDTSKCSRPSTTEAFRPVTCFECDADKIVQADYGSGITVFETKQRRPPYTLPGHQQRVTALLLLDHTLISGSLDGTIHIWDLKERRLRAACAAPGPIHCLGVVSATSSADGEKEASQACPDLKVICSYGDSTVGLWDFFDSSATASNEPVGLTRSFRGHRKLVGAIAACGNTLATGSADTTARCWELDSGKELCVLTSHTREVISVVVYPEKSRCITMTIDSRCKIWDISTAGLRSMILLDAVATDRYLQGKHLPPFLPTQSASYASLLRITAENTNSWSIRDGMLKVLSHQDGILFDRQYFHRFGRELYDVTIFRSSFNKDNIKMFVGVVQMEGESKAMVCALPLYSLFLIAYVGAVF